MERCSIWGATIAQVRLSCYQFLLVASSPKFQSQQSLRSLQRQTYKSIPNLMWNPHQTIWSRANHRFLIRIIGLACWNCSSVPRLRQLAGICISLGTIRKSTSAELDEGGVLILPKCQVSKGCAMRGPQPYQILTKCGRACDFTSKALCSLPALTRRGLLRHLPWARPRWFLLKWWSWPEQFSQAFRPEPVRRRETCKQNPQTLLKFEENLQMTSNDHRLPAQVKSASLTLTLTLGHCALHFSGTSSPWLKIASHKYSGHPWYRTFQLLKKPTNVLLATTPFLEARGSSASTFLRWLCRQEEFQVLQNSGHEGVATHKLQNTACCLVTALDAASLNVWIIEGRNDFVIRLLLAWHPCTELDSYRGKAGYELLGQRSI